MSAWRRAPAPAKLNLALVVGPLRANGKHEVVTVLERLSLADTVAVRPAPSTRVSGFEEDTLVGAALQAISASAEGAPRFEARIEKRIPVAAGLGGGSSDAAAALLLANGLLDAPLPVEELGRIAATLGADVPFFLGDGAQLGTADGTALRAIVLPRDYAILLALPHGESKASTRDVYAAFDARGGARVRRPSYGAARSACARGARGRPGRSAAERPRGLAAGRRARALGAFRADVTGAGPVVYGLFPTPADAHRAAATVEAKTTCWVVQPG